MRWERTTAARRPTALRLGDFREVDATFEPEAATKQNKRCMDCGVPFCQSGCPLGNEIPDFNDLVYRGDWRGAWERLTATNPWPQWPVVRRTSSSQQEGGERAFARMTTRLEPAEGGDRLGSIVTNDVTVEDGTIQTKDGPERSTPCDMLLLAMGFVGPELDGLDEAFGDQLTLRRGEVHTGVAGLYAAGDVSRGASLVVWANADGRRAAEVIDADLSASPARRADVSQHMTS